MVIIAPGIMMSPMDYDQLVTVPLFAGLDRAVLESLGRRLATVHLRRGQVLFREGDPGHELFVVATGEVRVVSSHDGSEVARLGPGEHVGEMALLATSPRSATVVACCNSMLWRLRQDDFQDLSRQFPPLVAQVAVALAQRLREMNTSERRPRPERVVVMVDARDAHAGAAEDFSALRTALAAVLSRPVAAATLSDVGATVLSGKTGAGEVAAASAPSDLGTVLDTLLHGHEHILLSAKAAELQGLVMREVCGRADLILIAVDAGSMSHDRARRVVDLAENSGLPETPPIEFLLDRRSRPAGDSFKPVDALAVKRVVHKLAPTAGYPADGPPDFAGWGRVARRIARRRIGLALGGGGARAFAHIGVLATLEQAGVPVDVLAGTSGGAIVGGLSARGWDSTRIAEFLLPRWTRRGVVDLRLLPWISLLRGRKLERIGLEAGEGLSLEELDRPFVAVAADLVSGQEVRLSRGDGWTAVRASLAVPGVFPPVAVDGRYLVDGGAIDNLPVAAAREAGADLVIGVDVSPPLEPAFADLLDDSRPRRVRGMLARLRRGPHLFRIIYRTVTVQGQALRAQRSAPDLRLAPEVADFDMFEFGDLRPIIERGRSEAQLRLPEVLRVTRGVPVP
jgi:NTE family protein